LSVNVTPFGRGAVSASAATGKPVAVTVKVPAAPEAKVRLLALVITGAAVTCVDASLE
jgi:hypothetical protein